MTDMLLGAPGIAPPPLVTVFASQIPTISSSGFMVVALPSAFSTYESAVAISQAGMILMGETKTDTDIVSYSTLPLVIAISSLTENTSEDFAILRHRHQELEWRRTHGNMLQTFTGQWVVLEREEIVAYGHDPVQVVREAREKGIRVPYIFYVESEPPDIAKMGL